MFPNGRSNDDTHVDNDAVVIPARRYAMFQDSFSEGHIYWGRFAMVITAATVLAYAISLIH